MALGNERDDLGPQMRRRGEPMQEHDWLAGSASAGRIVVEARPVYVDELSPHRVKRPAEAMRRGSACMVVLIEFTWQDVPARASSQANRGKGINGKHPLASRW